ncbi:hypothetical protein GKD14_12880 [Paeniclostridium sordellii]|nr:hypothetical protein [Paeniclostridium sordellii]MSB59838.1 hypothetical protein [Paeniclostridium sordellii]
MHKLENIMDNTFDFLYKSQEKRNAKLNREGTLFLFRCLLMPFINIKKFFKNKLY